MIPSEIQRIFYYSEKGESEREWIMLSKCKKKVNCSLKFEHYEICKSLNFCSWQKIVVIIFFVHSNLISSHEMNFFSLSIRNVFDLRVVAVVAQGEVQIKSEFQFKIMVRKYNMQKMMKCSLAYVFWCLSYMTMLLCEVLKPEQNKWCQRELNGRHYLLSEVCYCM